MTLIVELTPEMEARLCRAASQQGVGPEQYARDLIARRLPDERSLALAALMQEWIAEDATEDEAELARREVGWEETRRNLEASRLSLAPPEV